MANGIFKLVKGDWAKALIIAVFTGALLPISIAIQTPGFNVATTDWGQVLVIALNGAVVGAVSYLAKQFLSDDEGKFGGVVG